MFMNDNLNDYFSPMGINSVVLERPKEWVTSGNEAKAVVAPDMCLLIDALRVKRPTWRFKSMERVYGEGHKLRNFDVYDGDEKLGTVWTESHWRTGTNRYCFNNHRLEKSRQRGFGGFSTKQPVATKKILDSFGTKSLDELAEEVANKVRDAIGTAYSRTNYIYSTAKQKAKNALVDYIEANWDTLKVHAQGCSDLDLHELRRRNEATERAYNARERGESVTIFMHGEKMLMNRSKTPASLPTTKPVTFDQLTEKQRAALGMLKLMEDGAFIDDVGMRVDRDTFYLLD
jgi:hypothetical protein